MKQTKEPKSKNKPTPPKPTPLTIIKLYSLSANKCSNPNCDTSAIRNDKTRTNIAEVAHIQGEKEGSARYNRHMTDEERRHLDNLILLCRICHKIVDDKRNIDQYPTLLLREWKEVHENKSFQQLTSNTAPLRMAINAIANYDFPESEDIQHIESLDSYAINIKISHNNLKRNKSFIEKYKIFHTQVNSLYNELESQNSFKKEKLLRNINMIYDKIKCRYVDDCDNEIEAIRQNADNIFEEVENKLLEFVVQNNHDGFYFAVQIIMVDAFIRCKILEEPPKINNDNK